jgi:hypothetical protein
MRQRQLATTRYSKSLDWVSRLGEVRGCDRYYFELAVLNDFLSHIEYEQENKSSLKLEPYE